MLIILSESSFYISKQDLDFIISDIIRLMVLVYPLKFIFWIIARQQKWVFYGFRNWQSSIMQYMNPFYNCQHKILA